jgi:hypothetical protein
VNGVLLPEPRPGRIEPKLDRCFCGHLTPLVLVSLEPPHATLSDRRGARNDEAPVPNRSNCVATSRPGENTGASG